MASLGTTIPRGKKLKKRVLKNIKKESSTRMKMRTKRKKNQVTRRFNIAFMHSQIYTETETRTLTHTDSQIHRDRDTFNDTY